ncbi:MAG: bifunctional phosphoribosylaminoimidazolecarboxamide formyltransferase/IMP cyclohydrolase [Thermoflexales bacterium]|nr:bifunctional phosphoribosylaminoimidazolecarboxamide formyltransferase/IMP cyclohydrolase [Thermoflexales bacterium]
MIALLSVSDKTGLVAFAGALSARGISLIASGGTARALQGAGLPVRLVEEVTGSPEILDGRVKTLHPAIHAGILARDEAADRADLARVRAPLIDLVVVNLYPFEKTVAQPYVTLADAIEMIDIGGSALLRAAAKNYQRVAVVCDPHDYELVLREIDQHGAVSLQTREVLALKAFARTAAYDAAIRDTLTGTRPTGALAETLPLRHAQPLRYGENPHQTAALFTLGDGEPGPLGGRLLQGKELSYNNLLDLDAAWRAVCQHPGPAAVVVKHLSPCGIACGAELPAAAAAAIAADAVSAFGGVLAFNRAVDAATVEALGELYIEGVVAPAYAPAALAALKRRKACRVVEAPSTRLDGFEYRSITGGLLRQSVDAGDPADAVWRTVTRRAPSTEEQDALAFAWRCVQHVKSNAIVLARQTAPGLFATVGIGGGQPNRVDGVRLAIARAGDRARGAVMASDAFFPFPDSVEVAAAAGVTAIVQPGGSVRDADAIAAADQHGLAMTVTGARHFRH